MNNLMQPPMPRMQPQFQSALMQAPPGEPQPQAGPNQLQGTPPGQQLQPLPPAPPSPQQVQQAHEHLSDSQEVFANLLKKPDSEMTMKQLFRAAADMVTKHQLHEGKRGAPAALVASEFASPDFPKEDAQGNPPPPKAIRQYLQNHFDKAVIHQAMLTAKFGGPIPHIKPEEK